jgi:TfoX/Sxy family transcriptional regulator of competence genes
MPYSEKLAGQLRQKLDPIVKTDEKKMFGGICFLLNGNMLVGVIKDDLIVRVGKESHQAALQMKGARPFDFSGKPMNGWVTVGESGQANLQNWIDMALNFVRTLPPK